MGLVNAIARIYTDDDEFYDLGEVFLYDDEEGFAEGVKALYRKVFKDSAYIIFDAIGANIIPTNRICTIRVDRDIPTV